MPKKIKEIKKQGLKYDPVVETKLAEPKPKTTIDINIERTTQRPNLYKKV